MATSMRLSEVRYAALAPIRVRTDAEIRVQI